MGNDKDKEEEFDSGFENVGADLNRLKATNVANNKDEDRVFDVGLDILGVIIHDVTLERGKRYMGQAAYRATELAARQDADGGPQP